MGHGLLLALLLAQSPIFPARGSTVLATRPVPLIRGSNANSSNSVSSIAVTWPGGTVAGDLAIIFTDAAFNITVPSGWTNLYLHNGTTWNVLAASKVLSSGDISTGSVTVSAAGSFDMHIATVTFIGGTSGVRETQAGQTGGAITFQTLTTTGAVQSTDTGLYWVSIRQLPNTLSVTPGTGPANTLQPQFTTTNCTSFLADQYMAGGAQTNTFNYTPTGGQSEAVQVIVQTP